MSPGHPCCCVEEEPPPPLTCYSLTQAILEANTTYELTFDGQPGCNQEPAGWPCTYCEAAADEFTTWRWGAIPPPFNFNILQWVNDTTGEGPYEVFWRDPQFGRREVGLVVRFGCVFPPRYYPHFQLQVQIWYVRTGIHGHIGVATWLWIVGPDAMPNKDVGFEDFDPWQTHALTLRQESERCDDAPIGNANLTLIKP